MMNSRQLGVRSLAWVSWLFFTLLLCLGWPSSPSADQAQYVYDELGRLIVVVDGQGNLAIYEYDQVGNLLSVTREVTTPPVITTIAPNPLEAGRVSPMSITGSGFLLGTVTTSNPDILINSLPGNTDTQLEAAFTIPNPTFFGTTTVTVNGPGGSVDTTVTVVQPVPIITQLLPATGLVGSTVGMTGTGFGTTPGSNHVTFTTTGGGRVDAIVLAESYTSVSVEVPVGAVSGDVTVEVGSLTSSGVAFGVVDPETIPVTAELGTPTNTAEPSVNSDQRVGLVGVGFVEGATGTIPTLDANGVLGSAVVSLVNVSPDGTFAQVVVPALATTGVWVLSGTSLDGVRVQVVPALTELQGTVVAGNPLDILGSGFQEGGTTVFFPGSVVGIAAPDVTGNNEAVTVIVPIGVLSDGLVTVRTVGGTSNPLSVGPPVLLGINSTASSGTPVDPTLPSTSSTNGRIELQGLNLSNGLPVTVSATTDTGLSALVTANTSGFSNQGMNSTVFLPSEATTGSVRLGPWEVPLQIVPTISSIDALPVGTSFETGTVLTLRGRGYKEGATSVSFVGGGAPVMVDNVFNTNRRLRVTIPSGVSLVVPGTSTAMSVSTDGGTSDPFGVSHPLLTGVSNNALLWGTPQNPLEPAANLFQPILLQGEGFTEETRGSIHNFNSSGTLGTAIRILDNVSADGTSATISFSFDSIFTGPLTVLDNNFGPGSGSVPLQIVPTIRHIVGPVTAGAQIEIQGYGFDPNLTEVQFPGVPTPVTVEAASVVSRRGRSGTLIVPSGFDPTGSVRVLTPGGSSDPFDLELLTALGAEIEPNDVPIDATRTLICFLDPISHHEGRIDPVADVDVYRIDVDSSGGLPYDGVIALVNAADPPLTLRVTGLANDGTVLFTEEGVVSAVDSGGPGNLSFSFVTPGPGKYFLKVEETTGQGSPAHAYQMNIQFFFDG